MATLWDVVTGNSALPVRAGTTFYDHLNNQKTGGGELRIVEGNFVSNIITQESVTELIDDSVISYDKMLSEVSSDMIDVVTNLIRTDIDG